MTSSFTGRSRATATTIRNCGAECMVGARGDEDYLALFREVGFEDAAALEDADYVQLSRSVE